MLAFVETSVFTRQIVEKLSDDEYAQLQAALVFRPEAGDLIPGGGGIRKIRWGETQRHRGKRGGVRVIYYWYEEGALIYMLLVYSKGEKDDLSPAEKRLLKHLVSEEFK